MFRLTCVPVNIYDPYVHFVNPSRTSFVEPSKETIYLCKGLQSTLGVPLWVEKIDSLNVLPHREMCELFLEGIKDNEDH